MYLEHSEITHWLYQQGNDKLDFFAFPVDNLKCGSLRIPLALPTERENGGSQYYIWETESADVLKKTETKRCVFAWNMSNRESWAKVVKISDCI